jgi:hypothetical protein
MIWQLVKRDPAWRMMPYFAGVGAMVWGFGSSDPAQALATVLGISAIGMCISYRGFRQRYTRFQLTLPIAGKQLFLSRILSLLAFIWVPILCASAAMAVVGGNWTWHAQLALLEYLAVATLAVLLIECVRVQTIDPPGWLAIIVFGIIVVSAPTIGLILPGSATLIVAVLGGCALASAGLFLKAWSEVPKCFQLAPAQAVFERAGPGGPARTRASAPHAIAWWPMFRAVYFGNWNTGVWVFAMLFVLVQLVIFGSGFAVFALVYIPLTYAGYRTGLRWLIHLPISARKLLWVVWAPTTAAVIIGLTLTAAAVSGLEQPHKAAVTLEHSRSWAPLDKSNADESGTMNVQVRAGYWRWARGGSAPVIEAPWGESYRPETSTRWRLAFYNPYSVGRESSQRFLEWQFLRATQAVYGQAIPVSQIEDLARMKTTLQQPRARVIIPALVLLYFLIQMCALHLSGWKRIRYTRAGFRAWLATAPMFAAFLLVLAPFPRFGDGGFLIETLLLCLAGPLADHLWMLALMLVPMAGLYWLAEKLWRENDFGQIEIEARARQAQALP